MRVPTKNIHRGSKQQDKQGKKLEEEGCSQEAKAWGLPGWESGRIISIQV